MQIYMYVISILCIILGFVALLTQRIYIDSKTMQATELRVPFLGRVKTNYPALIFVFLGFGLSTFAFDRSDKFDREKLKRDVGVDTWTIHGSFYRDSTCTKKIDFEKGQVALNPTEIVEGPDFNSNGDFKLKVNIPKDKPFEEAISSIFFTLDSGQAEPVNPIAEMDSFKVNPKKSRLTFQGTHERSYRIHVSSY